MSFFLYFQHSTVQKKEITLDPPMGAFGPSALIRVPGGRRTLATTILPTTTKTKNIFRSESLKGTMIQKLGKCGILLEYSFECYFQLENCKSAASLL